MKNIYEKLKDCLSEFTGILFVLFAAPVIHLSGLDKTDDAPTKEEIEKSIALAKKLNSKEDKM